MLKNIGLQINGVHCKSCKTVIEAEVEVLPGIKSINVNPKTGRCQIEYNDNKISLPGIIKAIEKHGYQVVVPKEKAIKLNKSKLKILSVVGVTTLVFAIAITLLLSSGSNELSADSSKKRSNTKKISKVAAVKDGFVGDKGLSVEAKNGSIYIDESQVSDGNLQAFNYYSDKAGKNIYFFVVMAPDGTYRAAANACEVCYGAKKGFSQVGDQIRCENCQVTYPKSKIAMEKGGCNPGPIDKNVTVADGNLIIDLADVEAVSYLF
jgi:uncharacterized membrane protein